MKDTEKQKALLISAITIAVAVLDQLTKWLISSNMQVSDSIPLISNIFHLTYIQNTGAGFGLFQDSTRLLIWFSIIVIGLIFYFYDAIPEGRWNHTAIALILGGTLGNLIDRINLGHVVDFLDFRIWPAFNIADSAITAGVTMLIIYMVRNKRISGST